MYIKNSKDHKILLPQYLYLYKIESLNLVIVCVADANANHDISYTTGFSMFRRWMLAHYIGDFVSVAQIMPRKITYLYIYKVAAFFDLCPPIAPRPFDLEG